MRHSPKPLLPPDWLPIRRRPFGACAWPSALSRRYGAVSPLSPPSALASHACLRLPYRLRCAACAMCVRAPLAASLSLRRRPFAVDPRRHAHAYRSGAHTRVHAQAAAHDRQVEEVVKRNSHQVQHVQQVAAAHKEYLNSERCGEKDEQTDASDAGMLLPSPHLSAAATASPVVSIPSTPRPADAALSMATPIAPAAAPSSAGAVVGERKLSPRKQQQLMVPLAKKSSMLDEAEAMPKQTLSAQITPRVTETPRRPEMPTILEEEFEDSDRWLDLSRPMERSFERIYYKVELPNGGGFTYCYCIQWADGSTRWVHGVPAVVACAGRQHRARRGF